MADFRKLLFALAAVTLVFATAASAQVIGPYHCDASAVPTLVRSEGIAEQVGDVLLTCSGTVPGAGITANVRIRLNTNVTSQVLDDSPDVVTDSLLLLNEPPYDTNQWRGAGSAFCCPSQTAFQGIWLSDTELEFDNVVLVSPGSSLGVQVIRITNVRANASALGDNATVFATINITGSTTVPVNNNSLVVADTRPGLKFSVDDADFKNCENPEETLVTLKFKEGFASAFRPALDAGSDHTVAGAGYQDESGFMPELYDGDLIQLAKIGQATQGTRLMARISDVPEDVTLEVPQCVTTGAGLELQLVDGENSSGSGGTVDGSCTSDSVEVTDRVVYEVTEIGASIGVTETVEIPVTVSFSIPAHLGTALVKGTFAPLSDVFSIGQQLDEGVTPKRPRFIDNGEDTNMFSIGPCRTILLFPFVTNQAGFDTGIAISNTSMDPLGTKTQEGACSLYYYGNSNGGAAPTNPQTTDTVPAGEQTVGTLSSGGALAFPATPGFQGYIFAICDFQFAHGYAFISDLGAQKLSQGYLALVIPDRGNKNRAAVDSSYGAAGNQGENTGN